MLTSSSLPASQIMAHDMCPFFWEGMLQEDFIAATFSSRGHIKTARCMTKVLVTCNMCLCCRGGMHRRCEDFSDGGSTTQEEEDEGEEEELHDTLDGYPGQRKGKGRLAAQRHVGNFDLGV